MKLSCARVYSDDSPRSSADVEAAQEGTALKQQHRQSHTSDGQSEEEQNRLSERKKRI